MSVLEKQFNSRIFNGDEIDANKIINHQSLQLARTFNSILKPSRELSLAITKLQEAKMWANEALKMEGLKEVKKYNCRNGNCDNKVVEEKTLCDDCTNIWITGGK